MIWPARTAICLDCRTAVPAGERCRAGPHHRVRPLDAAGRERLLRDVWGPPSRRRRMRALDPGGAIDHATGTAMERVADYGGGAIELAMTTAADEQERLRLRSGAATRALLVFGLAIVALGVVFAMVMWPFQVIARHFRGRSVRLEPHGALAAPAAVPPRAGRAGTVVGATVPAPLNGHACVGFAHVLTHGPDRAVMLRDAATIGFDLVLDDGARVRIPAGPLIVDPGKLPVVSTSDRDVDRYLRGLDPARARADDLDPFPHDRVEAALIRPGDRLEIIGSLRSIADGAAAATDYREAAATVLVPDATPRLRWLDPAP